MINDVLPELCLVLCMVNVVMLFWLLLFNLLTILLIGDDEEEGGEEDDGTTLRFVSMGHDGNDNEDEGDKRE